MNQELQTYVQQQLQAGVPEEQVRQALLDKGWDEQIVNNVLPPKPPAEISLDTTNKNQSKLLIVSVVGVILLIVSATVYLLLMTEKEVTVTYDDSDLMLPVVQVPDEENMYYELVKLDAVLFEPEFGLPQESEILSAMVEGKDWDAALAEEIISNNTEALAIFDQAAKLAKYQDPAAADPNAFHFNTLLPNLNSFRDASKYSLLFADQLAREGKYTEALDEALKSVKIGHAIESSQTPIIEYLVGLAIKNIGLTSIQNIINNRDLNIGAKTLTDYAQQVATYSKDDTGLTTSLKLEYIVNADFLDRFAAGEKEVVASFLDQYGDRYKDKLLDKHYFDTNETKSYTAHDIRLSLNNSLKQCHEESEEYIPPFLDDTNDLKMLSAENSLGKIIHKTTSAQIDLRDGWCKLDVQTAATQTLLGIKAFVTDSNNYPDTLEELIPTYLPQIPTDPYSNSPIKYSKERKIIYSIGNDFIDNDGISEESGSFSEPDVVYKIEF